MSIQDKITRLQTAKEGIADAITAAGGTVAEGDGFEEFSSDIGTISGGISVDEDYTVSEGVLTSASVELVGDVVANIPSGVTSLRGAFSNNQIINKITMPNSVTVIEDGSPWSYTQGCFYKCLRLSDIIMSTSLTTIGNFAFSGCIRLQSIAIPISVTSIGENAFRDCTGLTSIVIPDSVTSIGASAFENCTSLADIYYTGTQAEWEQITIGTEAIPSGATIHYNYTPTE